MSLLLDDVFFNALLAYKGIEVDHSCVLEIDFDNHSVNFYDRKVYEQICLHRHDPKKYPYPEHPSVPVRACQM